MTLVAFVNWCSALLRHNRLPFLRYLTMDVSIAIYGLVAYPRPITLTYLDRNCTQPDGRAPYRMPLAPFDVLRLVHMLLNALLLVPLDLASEELKLAQRSGTIHARMANVNSHGEKDVERHAFVHSVIPPQLQHHIYLCNEAGHQSSQCVSHDINAIGACRM